MENSKKIIKTIFLEELPRWGNSKNKGSFKWADCVNKKVKFIYGDIEGELLIEDYEKKESLLYIRYLDKEIFKINTDSFQKCSLGKYLGKFTNEFKIDIGKNFKDKKRDLTIFDRKYKKVLKSNNVNQDKKYYQYKCNICGFYDDRSWIEESNLLRGQGCSCCGSNPRIVVEGINDIPTTAPWMIKYFQGGYDEAKLYTKSSGINIYPICQDCGRIKDKEMAIRTIYNTKSIGCSCGDGVSYPEKILFSVLTQLKEEFKTQLTKSTFNWCGNYKYDLYIPRFNLICEVHGIQHYKQSNRGRTLLEEQENDKNKEDLAKDNNIENYIIIDCRYSELKWIKNSIMNSKLAELFDLSIIDWLKVEEFALSNLVKIICEIKRDDPDLTTEDIGSIMQLNRTTITKYLKKGSKVWDWCNYNPKEEVIKSSSKSGKKRGKQVEIFKDGLSCGIFENCHELDRISEMLFGVKLLYTNISAVCIGKLNHYKKFTFQYV